MSSHTKEAKENIRQTNLRAKAANAIYVQSEG
jgi:hypothetical protein